MESPRQHERVESIRPVYLIGESATDDFTLSLNVSMCGVCVLTSHDLTPGQKVTLYSKFFWPDKMNAVVIWCTEMKGRLRRAGFALCLS